MFWKIGIREIGTWNQVWSGEMYAFVVSFTMSAGNQAAAKQTFDFTWHGNDRITELSLTAADVLSTSGFWSYYTIPLQRRKGLRVISIFTDRVGGKKKVWYNVRGQKNKRCRRQHLFLSDVVTTKWWAAFGSKNVQSTAAFWSYK